MMRLDSVTISDGQSRVLAKQYFTTLQMKIIGAVWQMTKVILSDYDGLVAVLEDLFSILGRDPNNSPN